MSAALIRHWTKCRMFTFGMVFWLASPWGDVLAQSRTQSSATGQNSQLSDKAYGEETVCPYENNFAFNALRSVAIHEGILDKDISRKTAEDREKETMRLIQKEEAVFEDIQRTIRSEIMSLDLKHNDQGVIKIDRAMLSRTEQSAYIMYWKKSGIRTKCDLEELKITDELRARAIVSFDRARRGVQ